MAGEVYMAGGHAWQEGCVTKACMAGGMHDWGGGVCGGRGAGCAWPGEHACSGRYISFQFDWQPITPSYHHRPLKIIVPIFHILQRVQVCTQVHPSVCLFTGRKNVPVQGPDPGPTPLCTAPHPQITTRTKLKWSNWHSTEMASYFMFSQASVILHGRGCAWQGLCMAGDMHGRWACLVGRVCVVRGGVYVAGGMHGEGGVYA